MGSLRWRIVAAVAAALFAALLQFGSRRSRRRQIGAPMPQYDAASLTNEAVRTETREEKAPPMS